MKYEIKNRFTGAVIFEGAPTSRTPHRASTGRTPHFFATDERALADIREQAALQAAS